MDTNDPFLLKRDHAAEVFLIRHGDALPGPDEIIPGGVYDDLPLSRKGREQAEALAKRLKAIHFDAIYSSPLRRCQETAAPLARALQLTPILIDALAEVRFGAIAPLPMLRDGDDLEVLTQALQARQMDIIRLAGKAGTWDDVPGSEPSKQFRARVVTAINEIVHRHIGQRILVFAHGGVINAYVAEVLGLTKDFFFPCANTSISVVRASLDSRVLFVLNDIAHLH